jgi:hypothetical protein
LSSDFGPLLLRGVDRQVGLTERLAAAIHDTRHPSSMDHPLRNLLAQRMDHMASGYADANDAKSLRHDPGCTLGGERCPVDPEDALARAPTCSRLAHQGDRKDLSRLTTALVAHFLASSPAPPAAMVLALAPADAPTHGQQECAFSHQHSRT